VAGKKISVVAGDIGGLNAILPVLPRAIEAGCIVNLFLVGASATAVRKGTLKLPDGITPMLVDDASQVGDAMKTVDLPDLLVLAASQSDIGTGAIWDAASGFPNRTLAVQDLYGSLHPALEREEAGWLFDVVCVSDEFSKALMVQKFPSGAAKEDIVVTGGPQFDKLVALREEWNARRERIRRGFPPDHLVALVAGQPGGTAEVIMLLEGAAKRLKKEMTVILRQHSHSSELDQQLTQMVVKHLLPHGMLNFRDMKEVASVNEDLLPGADLVLSGYSTTGYAGILCGMPGVVYCGTPALRWEFRREKRLDRPPEVEAGAGWWVETADDLAKVITELRTTPESEAVQKVREAQAQIARYNNGHATDNVWAEIQKLLQ